MVSAADKESTSTIRIMSECNSCSQLSRNFAMLEKTSLCFVLRSGNEILAETDTNGSLELPSISLLNDKNWINDFGWERRCHLIVRAIDKKYGVPDSYLLREIWRNEIDGFVAQVILLVDTLGTSIQEICERNPSMVRILLSDFDLRKWTHCLSHVNFNRTIFRTSIQAKWKMDGWISKVHLWVSRKLKNLGIPLTGNPLQVYNTEFSSVIEFDVDVSHSTFIPADWRKIYSVFVKSVPNGSSEILRARTVSTVLPRFIPKVLAVSDDVTTMIQCGAFESDNGSSENPTVLSEIFETLFDMQMESLQKINELRTKGIPIHGIDWLAENFERYSCHPEIVQIDPSGNISRRVNSVRKMCSTISKMGIPDTLVHGDFVDVNVTGGIVHGTKSCFIDWERAHIGFPFFDCANWEIGFGLFNEFKDSSVKRKYLRMWTDYAAWTDIQKAAEMSQYLLRCYRLCTTVQSLELAIPSTKQHLRSILKAHVESVTKHVIPALENALELTGINIHGRSIRNE